MIHFQQINEISHCCHSVILFDKMLVRIYTIPHFNHANKQLPVKKTSWTVGSILILIAI